MSRVLIVEPDKELAEVMKRALTDDYEVVIAHTAQNALSEADELRPDVVVLELSIAKHNGVSFLQEFKSYQDWQEIPVVVYSQISREDTGLSVQQWHKLGVNAYLYKPTARLVDLSNTIEQLLINYETA